MGTDTDETWIECESWLAMRPHLDAERILAFKALSLPAPIVEPREDGSVLLTWTQARYHLEVDLYPNHRMDWFYSDRVQGLFDGTEESIPERPWPRTFLRRAETLVSP